MTVQPPRARGPLSNFVALGTSEIIARAAGFLATALLARRLGVPAFGVLGLATATVAYFGLALSAGFSAIAAREVAWRPGDALRIAADATIVRSILAVCGIALVAAVSFWFVDSSIRRAVLVLTSLSLLPLALDTGWVYRGLGRNHIIGFGLVAAQLLYLTGAFFFVGGPADVERVPVIVFGGELVAAAVLLTILFGRNIPRPSVARGMVLLRQSGFVTLGRLLRALIVTFDVILLGVIASNSDVGLYTAAYRVCFLIVTIAVSAYAAFMPSITRAAQANTAAIGPVATRALSLTSAVIVPMVAGGIVLAGPLLAFLFGTDYADGARAFQILLASIALLSFHGAGHNVYVALHRTGLEAAIFGAAAVLNIALNLALIPQYGLIGAASATLAAEALILASSAIALHRLGVRISLDGLVRPLGAAIVMGASLYAVAGRVHVALLVAAGAAIYAALLAITDGFPKELPEPLPTHDV